MEKKSNDDFWSVMAMLIIIGLAVCLLAWVQPTLVPPFIITR